ncbi:claudin-11-like [Menidia menidia]
MAHLCRQLSGSFCGCAGWVGLLVASATSDWVRTCDYAVATCVRMDDLGSKGLWAECVISPARSHCTSLNQVFELPAYMLSCRALMVVSCLLGLPAMLLVLVSMSFVRMPSDSPLIKKRRAQVGGALVLIMGLCGLVATVWFPVGAHREEPLMSFGLSLYAGWGGAGLCLLGGVLVLCCHVDPPGPSPRGSFYYSRRGDTATQMDPPNDHAKSVHV